MGRAPCCDKANVKRGPWSPEEDATLKNYIENYGTGGNWISLPSKAGLKRCGKSCRLRWLNYLRPDIKHGGFTEEEDDIICTLYATIGSRWSFIASQLPGRTDNDVKNYWNTKLKKKQLVPKIDVSNEILRDNNSATHDPIPKYWDSIAQIEAYFNPENSDSVMEILDNHKYYCDQQGLFLDQTQFRPVSTLMDVPNFSFGCNSVSPSQQVSSFSPSSSSLVLPLDNNCGGSVQAIDGILPYFGFESPNYELLNDLGLQ